MYVTKFGRCLSFLDASAREIHISSIITHLDGSTSQLFRIQREPEARGVKASRFSVLCTDNN